MNLLVTGAGGGMGTAVCRMLTQMGLTVWGLDISEKVRIDGVRFIPTNLTDMTSVASAFEKISAQTDSIDAIIHMAGIYDMNSLAEMPEEDFKRIFDINLFGVYRVNKVFMPLLKAGSRIIITTSELAPLDPLPFTGIYGITKSALEKYAYSLRMELNLLGIKVSVIRPGAVNTGLLGDSTDALDAFTKNTFLYKCSAAKFRKIVDSVEARSISPEKIAKVIRKAVFARRPRYVYCINRNPLLLLLNALPHRLQVTIIKMLIKG